MKKSNNVLPDKQAGNRDSKGRFKPGASGNPTGRPAGVSIREEIKQHLREHPEKLKELCDFYLNNEDMRELLWKMLDGMPKNSFGDDGEGFPPFNIIIKNGADK